MSDAAGDPGRRGSRLDTRRVIRWLLAAQVGIAVLLAGSDFLRVFPDLARRAGTLPGLDAPVRPGDQTRRFPAERPWRSPDRPGFAPGSVPGRLTWTATQLDGAAALAITGEIDEGAADRFAGYLDGLAEPPRTVSLHSPGGSVADAIAIGTRLRDSGIATRVGAGDACYSACPYILAGGVERTVSGDARVGVHQHYFGESTVMPAFLAVDQIQRGQADLMEFLERMGVDLLLMSLAMRTPPDAIYVLVEEELIGLALATSIED